MKIETLGFPTAKTNQLKKNQIETVEDLIRYLPRKYYDFSKQLRFSEGGDTPGLFGGIVSEVKPIKNGVTFRLKDELSSDIGFVTFFGQPYLKSQIQTEDMLYIGGKVEKKFGKYFISPLVWGLNRESILGIQPVYKKIKGMSDDYLKKAILTGLSLHSKDDYLEPVLLREFGIVPLHRGVRGLHQPKDMSHLEESMKRSLFDELFEYNFHLLSRGAHDRKENPYPILGFDKTTSLLNQLPFSLTEGQREVLRAITRKMRDGQLVDALVMGDVGCGKTMVALLLMVGQSESGYQSVLMAPTNVLAMQHYNEAKTMLEPLGIRVGFLNGGMKVRERKSLLKDLKSGEIDILIGTHACIHDEVEFHKLSLCVVDEEHRFGVRQREAIRGKVELGIHMVSMSATPIPRSLATTLYGEHVDILTIKTLPSGRKPVAVSLHSDSKRPYENIRDAVRRGEQAYIVCPLIDDNDGMEDVKSVEQVFAETQKEFSQDGFVIDYISGNMKEEDLNTRLRNFKSGQTHILISTTVIEVGVNVPNATVMVIENAERFGSSQIWQLKGRVGRGSKPSSCFLVSPSPNPPSKEKLEMLCRAKDGFEVAKEDLRLRGAGSLLGDEQSGANRYISLILANESLNEKIRKEIRRILADEKRRNRYRRSLRKDVEVLEK